MKWGIVYILMEYTQNLENFCSKMKKLEEFLSIFDLGHITPYIIFLKVSYELNKREYNFT